MNKLYSLIIMFLTHGVCSAQNLVPNPDFETYSTCPFNFGQLYLAVPWINPASAPGGGTPDYFHQCSSSPGVPSSGYGFQYAHSGGAYGGILVGRVQPGVSNWREYAEVQLTSTLAANVCYHFEMYINLSDECQYTSDALGVYFSDTVVTGISNYLPLPYIPQINFNLGFITDTVSWIKVTGNYTATGGENYLIIGNFKDSTQTNMQLINPAGSFHWSYFYIEDVVLSVCTGMEEPNQNEIIKIYPNPFSDALFVYDALPENAEIIVNNILGIEIISQQFKNTVSLNTKQLAKGIYVYEVRNKNGVIKKGKVIHR